MKPAKPYKSRSMMARISIWTITNHDFLAGRIRTYVWSATATILFLSIGSIIPLQTALYLLLFCGLGLMILIWILINWRKAILLNIQDEKLRIIAHAAMLALIHARESRHHGIENHHGPIHRWLNRKSHF